MDSQQNDPIAMITRIDGHVYAYTFTRDNVGAVSEAITKQVVDKRLNMNKNAADRLITQMLKVTE